MDNGTVMAVEGWEDLARALDMLSDEMTVKAGNRAALAGANYLKGQISAALPLGQRRAKLRRSNNGDVVVMDYGHLRDNVKVRGAGKRARSAMNAAGYFEFSITPGHAFWGRFLEFGTVNQAARPIWRPVFDAETEATVEKVGNVLRLSIARLAGK